MKELTLHEVMGVDLNAGDIDDIYGGDAGCFCYNSDGSSIPDLQIDGNQLFGVNCKSHCCADKRSKHWRRLFYYQAFGGGLKQNCEQGDC